MHTKMLQVNKKLIMAFRQFCPSRATWPLSIQGLQKDQPGGGTKSVSPYFPSSAQHKVGSKLRP